MLGDTPLTWRVAGTEVPALSLEFGGSNDCGDSRGNLDPATMAALYWISAINSNPPDAEVVLLIPGGAINQAAAGDVEIEVDLDDVCERRTDEANTLVHIVKNHPRELGLDGIGDGAYFGAYGGPNAPDPDAVYQQLMVCDWPDVDDTWNQTTQRFETNPGVPASGWVLGSGESRVGSQKCTPASRPKVMVLDTWDAGRAVLLQFSQLSRRLGKSKYTVVVAALRGDNPGEFEGSAVGADLPGPRSSMFEETGPRRVTRTGVG